jgi:hypothetical protein
MAWAMRRLFAILALAAALGALAAPGAPANTSHLGWPQIDGLLLMNKLDQSRPLDARPGQDTFAGTDPSHSCDGLHHNTVCGRDNRGHDAEGGPVPDVPRHNELLGGHGDDIIHAGPWGDVIWGDFKPSGQPTSQHDTLIGGAGRDFIYASHGYNRILAGGGRDVIHAHFGHGIIDCGRGADVLYISRRAQRRYRIRHCDTISHATLGR